MGLYLEVAANQNKADQVMRLYNAVIVEPPEVIEDVPENYTLLCVVQNPMFDAIAICQDDMDLIDFRDPSDPRPKTWLLIETSIARNLNERYDRSLKGE